MRIEELAFVLQTSDPLFPTGAYAHSLGLEEIVRLGAVRDEESLRSFLRNQIVPALARQELPYLRFARAAAAKGNLEELCAIDAEIGAWKICRELREASIAMGVRRLNSLRKISPSPLLRELETRVSTGEASGHQLTVAGVQFARTPLEASLTTWLYQTLAAQCSAALKLIRIGQEGCQRALGDALRMAENTVADSLAVAREEAGCFNPLLEIAALRHARAGERLFIS